jgi:hypothetical protein
MQLKPFKITIEGTYCEVPHPDRLIKLCDDSETQDEQLKLTDIDTMVICNEVLCKITRRLQSVMTKQEIKKQQKNFDRFHLGVVTGKEKLKDIKIEISGNYCEGFKVGRIIRYNLTMLSDSQTNILLYEAICLMRNNLSKTMTRDELSEIANKFMIFNFGMLKGEEPFILRD